MRSEQVRSRPGGRSTRVREAVYAAVGTLVGAGVDRITLPIVAEQAGVNPTTLYRRWGDVSSLLEDATVAALTRDGEPVPDLGSLGEDLTAWATAVVHDIGRIERARFLRAMVSARHDLVTSCAVTDRRRQQAAVTIDRALLRGERAPTVDQVLDHVIAPLYYRAVFALPLQESDAVRLVRDVLAMTR